MTKERSFTTILCWVEGEENREMPVKVTYDHYSGGHIAPDGHVEIAAIESIDGRPRNFELWRRNEGLLSECMEDWSDDVAREYRAELHARSSKFSA